MRKQLLTATLFLGFAATALAQSLYIPRDIQKVYNKGTRSSDGRPGKNYWQNHARYNISVTAMPPGRNIQGDETITYFNNSPDTISQLLFKLYPNLYQKGAMRAAQMAGARGISTAFLGTARSISAPFTHWMRDARGS